MKSRLWSLTALVMLAACASAPAPKPAASIVTPAATAAAVQLPPPTSAPAPPGAGALAESEPVLAPAATPPPTALAPPAVTPPRPAPMPAAAVARPKPKPVPKATVVAGKPLGKPVTQSSAPLPAAVVAPVTAALAGKLQLVAGNGQKITAGEVSDGLVYYLPEGGAPKPKPGAFSINTQSKGFSPNLLVVPVGSTVSFPNKDTILHNVYSRSPGSTFELGTYGPGEVRKTVLRTPGLVIVNCNVHHNMRANIVVLSTPYYTRPGKDGSFQLGGLPAGKGTLVFWHPRSNAITQRVTTGSNLPVVKQLTASKPRLDAHMLMRP